MLQNERRQKVLDEIKKREDKNIADKAVFRDKINAFRERLEKQAPELAKSVGVDIDDLYAEKLLPLWYADSEDSEAIMKERAEAKATLDKFRQLEENLILKAEERLGL